MNLTQPGAQEISVGQSGFIAEAGAWNDAQWNAPGNCLD